MVHPAFQQVLSQHYDAAKAQFPGEGRRKWCLRVLHASWPSLSTQPSSTAPAIIEAIESDTDPLDGFLDTEEPGLVIRTDFTNEDAWQNFLQSVQAAQKEFLADLGSPESKEEGPSTAGSSPDEVAMAGPASVAQPAAEEEEDSDSSDELPELLRFIDPSDLAVRMHLTDISNIRALRLFNEVDIRSAPTTTSKRISPPNPLIDQNGWQEIYTGKNIWIYDALSNVDQCVRVVSGAGDFYGTATGDSWRARGRHVPELQFSMTFQGLKVDFNGLDKWDYSERQRNLSQAAQL